MSAPTYWFTVYADDQKKMPSPEFDDPADAMAAWSEAISRGAEYVTLEALRHRDPVSGKLS